MLTVIMVLHSSFPENFVETVFYLTSHVDKAKLYEKYAKVS